MMTIIGAGGGGGDEEEDGEEDAGEEAEWRLREKAAPRQLAVVLPFHPISLL
jgi:hypothetical protein